MDETIENQDSLNPEEDLDESSIVPEDDDLSLEEKNVKLDEVNKKLFARAKKAETELKALKLTPKEVEKPQPPVQPPTKVDDLDKIVDQKIGEKLGERELESAELSDDSKRGLKAYAKAEGLSIKQALTSDYFNFLKQKEEAQKRVEEAAIGGKHRAPTRKDFSSVKPSEFDFSTEEGRKEYEEYKEFRKKQS